MIPRGEISLIVGSVGFTAGLLNSAMLGEVLLMSLVTTVIGATLFRRRIGTLRGARDPAVPSTPAAP
ncbi:MAG TPA: hypothetical protein VEK13_04140 [Thermoplasmata archaeon]|nr:hypothetical protein [Thermoplasmata archaeon]